MAATKNRYNLPTNPRYAELVKSSSDANETNDCSVKAVALVTGLPYEKAHAALDSLGRKAGKGSYTHDILKAVENLGFMPVEVPLAEIISLYPKPHNKLKSVTTHHPERFAKVWPKGSYLLFSSHHVTAIVDGETVDWTLGRSQRALSVYRIAPVVEEPPAEAPVVEEPPAEALTLVWNTGCRYTKYGQRIACAKTKQGVLMVDHDRGIEYHMEGMELDRSAIQSAYNSNSYKQVSGLSGEEYERISAIAKGLHDLAQTI